MIIVGELINSSRKSVLQAIERFDRAAIEKLALDQQAAGADYIDVNAGMLGTGEAQALAWLVKTVQSVVELPCCIDSPDPKAIEVALSVHRGTPLINSISLEKQRQADLLPLLAGASCKVIALCMSDDGMPETAGQRLVVAEKLIERLTGNGMSLDAIHVDPLVQPVATNEAYGGAFLGAVEQIMTNFPGVHTICGLSNISFGLPNRKLLNRTFLSMAVARGLDGAIVDPLDDRMVAAIRAAEALRGRDRYCRDYLKAHRAGILEGA